MTNTESRCPAQQKPQAQPSPVPTGKPAPAPLCTHIMPSGVTCGSPAVSGTVFCYHHAGTSCPPIPFLFPADRYALQRNYFLLLQAFSEGRIQLRAFNSISRVLRSMDANLGKIAEETAEAAEAPTTDRSYEYAPAQKTVARFAPNPVAASRPPQPARKPYPTFEALAAQLKPLGADCFLNVPSVSSFAGV